MMDKNQAKGAVVKEIQEFVKEFEGLCEKHGILAMAVGIGVGKKCEGMELNAGFLAAEMPRLNCRQAGVFRNALMQAAEQGAKILALQKCVCKSEHEKPVEAGSVTVGKEEAGTEAAPDAELVSLEEFVNEGSPESKKLVDAILKHFGLSPEEFAEFRKGFEAAKWKKNKAAVRAAGAGGPSVGIDPATDPRTWLLHYGPDDEKKLKEPIRVSPTQVSAWMNARDNAEHFQIVDAVSGKVIFVGSPKVLVSAEPISR